MHAIRAKAKLDDVGKQYDTGRACGIKVKQSRLVVVRRRASSRRRMRWTSSTSGWKCLTTRPGGGGAIDEMCMGCIWMRAVETQEMAKADGYLIRIHYVES